MPCAVCRVPYATLVPTPHCTYTHRTHCLVRAKIRCCRCVCPHCHRVQDLDTGTVVATWSAYAAAWRWRSPVDGDELGNVYMAVEQKQGRIVLEDTEAAHAGAIVAMWTEAEADGRGWIWMQGDLVGPRAPPTHNLTRSAPPPAPAPPFWGTSSCCTLIS